MNIEKIVSLSAGRITDGAEAIMAGCQEIINSLDGHDCPARKDEIRQSVGEIQRKIEDLYRWADAVRDLG